MPSVWIASPCFLPDTSGNVYPKSSLIDDTNDRFPHEIMAYRDTTSTMSASCTFVIPKDYVSTPVITAIWKSTVTTGVASFTVATAAVATSESLDPSADTDSVTALSTTSTTALRRNDVSFSLTSASYAVDDEVLLKFSRNGGVAGDTLAAETLIEGVLFVYSTT